MTFGVPISSTSRLAQLMSQLPRPRGTKNNFEEGFPSIQQGIFLNSGVDAGSEANFLPTKWSTGRMRTQILPMWMAVMSTMASCASGTYPSVGGPEMRVPQEKRGGLPCLAARLLLYRWRGSLRGGSQPQISIGSQISLIS